MAVVNRSPVVCDILTLRLHVVADAGRSRRAGGV